MPDFLDYTMKNRTYRYFTGEPLFPFGHGLSYTTFEYKDLKCKNKPNGAIEMNVTVKNTGKVAGTETVQIYFRRIADKEGPFKESRQITLSLSSQNLETWDAQTNTMHFQPGQYQLMVGSSSDEKSLNTMNININ